MVVFACNACGSSVKKNQVEKHYMQQCRRCESLSCMDCGKDFWGEEYKHHTKCITEDEKYAAKGWQPKTSANKGERKQEAWIEAINEAVQNAKDMTPALRQVLETLTQHSNIPRKKSKFENFVSNSVHVRNRSLVEQAWQVFEAAMTKPKDLAVEPRDGESPVGSVQNGNNMSDGLEKKKKKKKEKMQPDVEEADAEAEPLERKKNKREKKMERSKKRTKTDDITNGKARVKRKPQNAEDTVDTMEENEELPIKKKQKVVDEGGVERLNETLDESALLAVHRVNTFDWTGVVLAILGNRDDHELSLKKLRKKIVSEYQARGGEGKPDTTKEKIWAKLDKKLKRMPQVKVLRDNVKLLSA